jgi:hypothetical protein
MLAWGLLGLATAQGIANFRGPLGQDFPDRFRERALSITTQLPESAYAFVNAAPIYPEPTVVSLPPYETALIAPHPLEYLPYQYEGFSPAQRRRLRSTDIRMRLVIFRQGGP